MPAANAGAPLERPGAERSILFAVVPNELEGWNISREVAVVPVASVSAKFVAFWIASMPCQNWLTGVAKGVAYTGINIEDLKTLAIALPSLAEQEEIVRRVEGLFTLADQLDVRRASATTYVGNLKRSILAMAFCGKLVPNERELAEIEGREFESAEDLLTRTLKSGESESSLVGKLGKPVNKRSAANN